MTTHNNEYEHNELDDTQSVDAAVVNTTDTLDTSTSDEADGAHSSSSETDHETSSEASSDTVPGTSEPSADETSHEQVTSEEGDTAMAPVEFAEETGNTLPEVSALAQNEIVEPTASEQVTTAEAATEEVDTPDTQVSTPETISTPDIQVSTSEERSVTAPIDATANPEFVVESEEVALDTTSLPDTQEALPTFSALVEEYHQAQAEAEAQAQSDLAASLQNSHLEALSEFSTPETDVNAVDQPISLVEALPPVDFGEGSAFVPTEDGSSTVNAAEINTQLGAQSPETAVQAEENQRVTASQLERPVSPLLRPGLRGRSARHGGLRHRDESTATPTFAATNETATSTEQTGAQEASASVEPPQETAKPPRRYRFDRPSSRTSQSQTSSASNVSSTSSTNNGKPASTSFVPTSNNDNSNTLTPPPSSQPTPIFAPVEETKAPVARALTSAPIESATSTTETAEKQSGEPTSMESTISSPSHADTNRRKHNLEREERYSRKEREKENAAPEPVVAPSSVADIAAALLSENDASEVAPEDLPPLEYADLQKANSSRRRRRHRTTGAPVAKESAPSIQNTPVSSAPLAPNAPITSVQNGSASKTEPAAASTANTANTTGAASPYSPPGASYAITSGYTVGQMNQGNEDKGPFMGPEPSPARGSVNTTRDGRTVRVESQPLRTSYPATNGSSNNNSGSISSASMNHFANVVSQAIQTQADRMVAELRRANQAPTNVSVSLPPFPSTERVGVFVDVANLLYSARTQRIGIDFGKLLDFLRGNRRLVRAHAYCPTSPQPGDEQMFLTAVKGLGYRITTKNYKTFASGAKKADLDLDLCMDVVRLVDGGAVDCIVLVSGDSDFMPMLDYCSDHGVRVEVAAFDEAMSATLRQSCDLFINLSMLEEIRA